MKFYVHRLGCPKNDVDADYLTARLQADGHTPVESPESAEAIIVNTCGFILPAKEESIEEILRLARLKRTGRVKLLYASGCLSQRYGTEMLAEMPELDGAFGVGALEELAGAMASSGRLDEPQRVAAERMAYIDYDSRYVDDRLPYAYLKISDGCNRTCAFCAIPSIRGAYRSRSVEVIVEEARMLAERGKKELILVSQESSLYGRDLGRGETLLTLLRRLDQIDGLEWIRVMYLYPSQLDDALIDYMLRTDNKTLDYFDIPLQHISDTMLTAMERHMSRQGIEAVLDTIRRRSDRATIRSAFIVGFPGETEELFEELLEFVVSFGFDRMGVFSYSHEDGTPAFGLEDSISEVVKAERLDRLMTEQQGIALARNNALLGTTVEVIIDAVTEGGRSVGRTRADCPEIDQEVFVNSDQLAVGTVCRVLIEGVDGYDLIGREVRD